MEQEELDERIYLSKLVCVHWYLSYNIRSIAVCLAADWLGMICRINSDTQNIIIWYFMFVLWGGWWGNVANWMKVDYKLSLTINKSVCCFCNSPGFRSSTTNGFCSLLHLQDRNQSYSQQGLLQTAKSVSKKWASELSISLFQAISSNL